MPFLVMGCIKKRTIEAGEVGLRAPGLLLFLFGVSSLTPFIFFWRCTSVVLKNTPLKLVRWA